MSPSLETIINWGDCDEAGVVHYPKYFYWMDSAFHGLLRNAGMSLRMVGQRFGAHLPIVEANARFLTRATFDEPLTVVAEIVHWGRKSLRIVYRGFRGDQQVFEGHEARVWALRSDGPIQTAPIPVAFKNAMTSGG
jgi:YbgC/YbaW family acyl-CoA thioester hydrolase